MNLRSAYMRLPVIRELWNIHNEIKHVRWLTHIRLRAELEAHANRLLQAPRYQASKRLTRFEHQVFSQSGEDGVIAEIFRRIGTQSKTFLEIGIGNGLENNTSALLMQHQWSGHWVDGDAETMKRVQQYFAQPTSEGRLKVTPAFVTAENINGLLQKIGVAEELDLFSLDIDRNTYWIWRALTNFRPRVVVVEYNATMPADVEWVVSYTPDRGWNGTSYFGASLKSFELLGRELGYSLVGCTLNGVNAFFVRDDLCGSHFEAPFTAEHHYEPPRYFLGHRRGHPAGSTDAVEIPVATWIP